jgi:hypothetical protein
LFGIHVGIFLNSISALIGGGGYIDNLHLRPFLISHSQKTLVPNVLHILYRLVGILPEFLVLLACMILPVW